MKWRADFPLSLAPDGIVRDVRLNAFESEDGRRMLIQGIELWLEEQNEPLYPQASCEYLDRYAGF